MQVMQDKRANEHGQGSGAQVGGVTWGAYVMWVSFVPIRTLTDGTMVDDTTAGTHTTGWRHCGARVAALLRHTRLLQLALDVHGAVARDWGCLRVRQVSKSEKRMSKKH